MPDKKKTQKQKIDPTVIVAVIGLIGTILTLMLTFEPLKHWWETRLNPPAASTPIPISETVEIAPSETSASMPSVVPAPAFTETFTPPATLPPTLTQPPGPGAMTAQIASNYSEIKPLLAVTFNAASSFVAYPDGSVETCEFAHVCAYTWDVRERNGGTIYGPEVGGSKFSYTFAKKGEYTVVAYVCRGQACNFAAASVTVR